MTKICKICLFVSSLPGESKVKNTHSILMTQYFSAGTNAIAAMMYISGLKNSHLGGSKMPTFAKHLFCSKCSQKSFGGLPWLKFVYLGGQKMPILGVKNGSKCLQRSFWGLPWPKSATFGGQKYKHLQTKMFCFKCPQTSFGHDQNLQNLLILGVKLSAQCCSQYNSL